MAKFNISKKANSKSYKSPYSSGKGKYQGGRNSSGQSQGDIRADARKMQGGTDKLTSESLKSANKIQLPSERISLVGDVAQNNAGFTGTNTSLSSTGNQLVQDVDPVVEDKFAGAQSNFSYLQSEMGKLQDEKTTNADIRRQVERDSGIKQARQQENDLSAQINTIIANRDANILSEEGQGRGIPESIIGGRQAKINKEASIAALPVQALLAQAQGNVALAEAHINTWGKILMDDANNAYNDKKELLTSAYDFAQGIEFKKIDELNAANERKYQEEREFIQAKTSAMANAAGQEAGQSVMSAIQSATTLEQVVAAAGKYNGDVLGREAQKASIANTYDQIASRATAAREKALAAAGTASEAYDKKIADTEQALEIKRLAEELGNADGGSAAIGFGLGKSIRGSIPFASGDAFAGTAREDFEALAGRLANLLTLDNLDLMSGVLSETDIKILETSGSNLKNFDMSEEAYTAEVRRIISTMDRTINNNGLTPEQANFYYGVDGDTMQQIDNIFGTSAQNQTLFPTSTY